MSYCPGATVVCSDNTCLSYNIHFACEAHLLHLGDRIKNTNRNDKLGYIYNVNPLRSKRSVIIVYDDETKESIFGHDVCAYIALTGDSRDTSKCDPRYL